MRRCGASAEEEPGHDGVPDWSPSSTGSPSNFDLTAPRTKEAEGSPVEVNSPAPWKPGCSPQITVNHTFELGSKRPFSQEKRSAFPPTPPLGFPRPVAGGTPRSQQSYLEAPGLSMLAGFHPQDTPTAALDISSQHVAAEGQAVLLQLASIFPSSCTCSPPTVTGLILAR